MSSADAGLSQFMGALRAAQKSIEVIAAEHEQQAIADLPLDADVFVAKLGRLPQIGDRVPPWKFRGWLLYHVQLMHIGGQAHTGGFPDRWGYYMRTLEAGKLLDEPIPHVDFEHANPAVLRESEKWVQIIETRGASHWSAFSDFLGFLAYGLAVSDEAPRLDDKVCEALYREVKLQRWLEHPSDYLGTLASERFGGGPLAFFPTPHAVCECMVRMAMADFDRDGGQDPRLTALSEPACGTGRLIMHASNYTMLATGLDCDRMMVKACRVNLAVFAPWSLYGLPFVKDPAPRSAGGEDAPLPPGPAADKLAPPKKRGKKRAALGPVG